MGRNKLLLPWQGKPILQHVLDSAATSPLAPLFLVLDQENPLLTDQIESGACRLVPCGSTVYSDSLRAGLLALDDQCAGAMFLLGDQPLVTSATITALITAFQAGFLCGCIVNGGNDFDEAVFNTYLDAEAAKFS